jgi:hypothetical protein
MEKRSRQKILFLVTVETQETRLLVDMERTNA